MADLNESDKQLSIVKKKIIKSLLYPDYEVIYCCYCRLYTCAVKSPCWLYSGIEGGLTIALDIKNKIAKFFIFDTKTYEILFECDLKKKFCDHYEQKHPRFHFFEINEGFIGFEIPNMDFANIMLQTVQTLTDDWIKKKIKNLKILDKNSKIEKGEKNIKLLKENLTKEGHNKNLSDQKEIELNQKELVDYIDCIEVDQSNNTIEFYGNGNGKIEKTIKKIKEINLVLKNDVKIADEKKFMDIVASNIVNSVEQKLIYLPKGINVHFGQRQKTQGREEEKKEEEIPKEENQKEETTKEESKNTDNSQTKKIPPKKQVVKKTDNKKNHKKVESQKIEPPISEVTTSAVSASTGAPIPSPPPLIINKAKPQTTSTTTSSTSSSKPLPPPVPELPKAETTVKVVSAPSGGPIPPPPPPLIINKARAPQNVNQPTTTQTTNARPLTLEEEVARMKLKKVERKEYIPPALRKEGEVSSSSNDSSGGNSFMNQIQNMRKMMINRGSMPQANQNEQNFVFVVKKEPSNQNPQTSEPKIVNKPTIQSNTKENDKPSYKPPAATGPVNPFSLLKQEGNSGGNKPPMNVSSSFAARIAMLSNKMGGGKQTQEEKKPIVEYAASSTEAKMDLKSLINTIGKQMAKDQQSGTFDNTPKQVVSGSGPGIPPPPPPPPKKK